MIQSPAVRTLALPLGIAVVFLLLTPKLCQRAVTQAAARKPAAQASTPDPTQAGLIIASSTPAPIQTRDLKFPRGLDAARIQYLVEIDPGFATATTMAVTATAPITAELLRRQYVEKHPDGTLAPTREGLINVNGAVDSSDGWTVPIAQRAFSGIEAIQDGGDGRYDVTVRWRWVPTAIGATVLPSPTDHRVIGEFAGGDGHWVLARWVAEPDRELR